LGSKPFFKKVWRGQGRVALGAARKRRNSFALEVRLLFLILFLFRKKGREKEYSTKPSPKSLDQKL